MDDVIIRVAKEKDFINISKLAEKCAPMATERDSIYHIFTKFFQNTVFVAEKDNKLLGFLLGFISQVNSEEAYIHLLCVDPDYRNKGLAKSFIKIFFKVIADMDCKKVFLITKPINQHAINFYKKLGFKKVDNVKNINLNGVWAVKDYNGLGKHMIVFEKNISLK